MGNRRKFITGVLAAGLLPKHTWAEAGGPSFLSAGRKLNGSFVLCGIDATGQISFEIPLPARGHAAAAHPNRAEAVAFARRPGTFAIVLDCVSGEQRARLQTPSDRHFYGHGAYSADGTLLFTTENNFDAGRGVVGVWDTLQGYKRIDEFASGGVGPHDIKLMPEGQGLVLANGGIETHPDTGRSKLNIPSMRSNLSYFGLDGQLLDQLELAPEHQRNSIRHLAVAPSGHVAFASQWQGDLTNDLPLLGVHLPKARSFSLMEAASVRRMNGYLGSVAISADGKLIAATSPRRGRLQLFDNSGIVSEHSVEDVCGVAATNSGFFMTAGTGLTQSLSGNSITHNIAWDNHLVAI